jgi:FKBP-type peptidyl-prolyl cis-trans isomerase SlpA
VYQRDNIVQTVQVGDRVRVHYVKRSQDSSVAPARSRTPVELTVGVDDPRLPGLGLALVGLAPGASTTVCVPAEKGHGPADPGRVRRWPRERFPKGGPLATGQWVRVWNAQGHRRVVRILEVSGDVVVVDTNRRWAGRALQLDVRLLGIESVAPRPDSPTA